MARAVRRLERGISTLSLILRGRALSTPGRPTTTIEIFVTLDLAWSPASMATIASRSVGHCRERHDAPWRYSRGILVRVELAAVGDEVVRSGQVQIQNGRTMLAVTLTSGA